MLRWGMSWQFSPVAHGPSDHRVNVATFLADEAFQRCTNDSEARQSRPRGGRADPSQQTLSGIAICGLKDEAGLTTQSF